MSAGLVVAVAVGVTLLVHGNTATGVFVIVAGPLTTGANVMMIRRAAALNQPGAQAQKGTPTGRRLAPAAAPAHALTWIGGANVATRFGRLNATWPLAVLSISGPTLTLRLRPRVIRMLPGGEPSAWNAADLLVTYPVRGRVLRVNRGVAIESNTAPLAYFWTQQPESVLAALAAHGMPVDWTERGILMM